MGSRLVNVRLDEERLRKAQKLRESGIVVSDVVREAIDERFRELSSPRRLRDIRTMMARIFEQYPDPPHLPVRTYSVHDRKQARRVIRHKLQRRRR